MKKLLCFLFAISCTGAQRPGTAGECNPVVDPPRCSADHRHQQFCASDGRWENNGNTVCGNGCGLNDAGVPVCLRESDSGTDAR